MVVYWSNGDFKGCWHALLSFDLNRLVGPFFSTTKEYYKLGNILPNDVVLGSGMNGSKCNEKIGDKD